MNAGLGDSRVVWGLITTCFHSELPPTFDRTLSVSRKAETQPLG